MFSFPFQAKKKIDGNAEALGGCCRFWAGSGGGLSDSTGRRTDGGTGGMWWLFLSLSRSRTHTHTHTQVEGIRENDCRNGFPGRQYRIVPVASLRTLVVGWTRWRSLLGVVVLGIPQVLTGWSVLGRSGGGKAGCSILSLFGVGIPQPGGGERELMSWREKKGHDREISQSYRQPFSVEASLRWARRGKKARDGRG